MHTNITNKIRIVFFALVFLGLVNFVSAQQSNPAEVNVIPPSPNVAAFNKFVDLPVSYYTGTPNISVPIYQIQMQQLSLPISLNYHASGLKVEEHASWVGAGWTLNAGGNISRTVKGLPDELIGSGRFGFFTDNAKRAFTAAGSVDHAEVLACDGPTTFITPPVDPVSFPDSLAQGFIDSEPDLYYFNFPGGSGKFVYDQDRQIIKLVDDDIKITQHPFISATLPPIPSVTDYQWTITGPNGIQYQFRKAERTKVVSLCGQIISFYNPSFDFYQSSWYLDRISNNGEWIEFHYADEVLMYDQRISESSNHKTIGGSGPSNIASSCKNDTDVEALRLDYILTSNGIRVDFIANTARNDLNGSKRLDKIIIRKDGQFVQGFNLGYGYFGTNDKLKLNEVYPISDELGTSQLNGYTFDYNGGSFPAMNSKDQDLWGYYNAKGNSSLIPSYKNSLHHVNTSSTASREPNFATAKTGTLSKITYPTGGNTSFEYELHDYYKENAEVTYIQEVLATGGSPSNPTIQIKNFVVGQNCSATLTTVGEKVVDSFWEVRKLNGAVYEEVTLSPYSNGNRKSLPAGSYQLYAQNGGDYPEVSVKIEYEQQENKDLDVGGLRIKRINFIDPIASKSITKAFKYQLAGTGTSSGVLFTPPLLGGYETQRSGGSVQGTEELFCQNDPEATYINLSAHTQIPLAVYAGSHIGYSEVTDYQIDGSSLPPNQSPVDISSSLGKTVYTYINDLPFVETTFPYIPSKDLSYKNGKLKTQNVYRRENNDVFTKVSEIINSYSEQQLSTLFVKGLNFKYQKNKYCYECGPDMYTYNEYEYKSSWHRLDETTEIQYGDIETQNREVVTAYFYENTAHRLSTSKDITYNDGRIFKEEYSRDVSKPALITQKDILVGKDGNAFVKIAGEQIAYNGIIPGSYSQWNPATTAYDLKLTNIFESNKLKTQIRYATNETSPQTKGLITNYIWGYNDTYPVAQIVNATASQIGLSPADQTTLNAANPSAITVRSIIQSKRASLTNALVTTYTYDPLVGIISITDPAGYDTHFDYDDFNRLILTKDDNEHIMNRYSYFYFSGSYPNYIKSELVTVADKKDDIAVNGLTIGSKQIQVNFDYLDGLGRLIQQVNQEASPINKDIIQPLVFDNYGRQVFNYLPYRQNVTSGAFRTSAISDQATFYNDNTNKVADDSRPYVENIFEDSPVGRVKETYSPGSDWHTNNRKITVNLKTNNANTIRYWYVLNNKPVSARYYDASALFIRETIDEENHKVLEYVDDRGLTILKEVQENDAGNSWLQTYYVYDDLALLRFVIPPEATAKIQLSNTLEDGTQFIDINTSLSGNNTPVGNEDIKYLYGPGVTITLADTFEFTASAGKTFSIKSGATPATVLDAYTFQYEYDERNRMIKKRVPGADWVYMVYDKWDRLILTQDGNQRAITPTKEWTFTKYDGLDRPIMSGTYKSNSTQATLISSAMTSVNRYENELNTEVGYSYSQTFPTTGIADADLLTVTYYDDYDFRDNTNWGTTYNFQAKTGFTGTSIDNPMGQITGGQVKDLVGGQWLKSASYYDFRSRVLQTISQNHLAGLDLFTSEYDFANRVTKTMQDHSSSSENVSVLKEFDYDHASRLLTIYQTIGTGPRILIASNKYNEIGELIEKNLHQNVGTSTFLQSVDYSYNIRGWLTHINNSALTNDGTYNDDTGDLFGMELLYNQAAININGTNTEKQFNGNISAIKWKTDIQIGVPVERIYGYTYDPVNRLTGARYAAKSATTWTGEAGHHDVENLTYDKNGNILSLDRYANLSGIRGVIDNLAYAYGNTNQLQSVQDTGTNEGFKDGVNLATEYAYDENGNMIYDLNKDITVIKYNYLNLPEEVEFLSGQKIAYTYHAAGTKLKKEVKNSDGSIISTVDYVNGFQYEDGDLSFLVTEEGRALKNGADFEYEYFLTDHLGNTRLTFGWLKEKAVFKATMETENNTEESADFINLTTRATSVANNHTATYEVVGTADEAARLNGYDNTAVGPGIVLANVVAGDKVSAEVFARYSQSTSTNTTVATTMFSLVASTFGIVNSGETAALYSHFDNNWASTLGTITSNGSLQPKAYLNYIIFRDDLSGVPQFGYIPVTTAATTDFEKLAFEIDIPYSGDMYIYVANESSEQNLFVWFDDLMVVHQKNNMGMEVTSADDYYPFGLQITQNAYQRESAVDQKYKFNGKELQEEIEVYDFTFRTYDPALGRTWQVDPRSDLFYEYSPYSWALGNPISIIDPTGTIAFPGDFYNENGKKIGTDGIDDGKVYVVADKKEAKAIDKTDKDGGTTQVTGVNSAIELPSANVREQMGKAVDRSNSPNESVGDTKGGFHEEGGIYGKTNGQEKVIDAQPGQAADPSKVDHAEVDVFSGETATNYLEEVEGTFHVHPKGEVKTGGGANTIGGEKTHSFDQSPSQQDYDAAAANGRTGNNYVLGAKGTVTIYNKNGKLATFPLKKFKTIGIKKK